MAALGLVVVHELGLNQDSLVSHLVSNRSQKLRKSVQLSLSKFSGRFRILNEVSLVLVCGEHLLDVVAETGIVD